MNINDLVTQYVTFRRTLGERCKTNESILRSFCRSIGPRTPVAVIGADAVTAFLVGAGPVTSAWHIRYHALKGFFRFAVSRGHLNEAPLPTVIPKPPPPFVPYIYSRDEIRRLLDAIPSYRRCRTGIEPETLRAILLLLYGAGLARWRGAESVRRGCRPAECHPHHPEYQVLQDPVGPDRAGT